MGLSKRYGTKVSPPTPGLFAFQCWSIHRAVIYFQIGIAIQTASNWSYEFTFSKVLSTHKLTDFQICWVPSSSFWEQGIQVSFVHIAHASNYIFRIKIVQLLCLHFSLVLAYPWTWKNAASHTRVEATGLYGLFLLKKYLTLFTQSPVAIGIP